MGIRLTKAQWTIANWYVQAWARYAEDRVSSQGLGYPPVTQFTGGSHAGFRSQPPHGVGNRDLAPHLRVEEVLDTLPGLCRTILKVENDLIILRPGGVPPKGKTERAEILGLSLKAYNHRLNMVMERIISSTKAKDVR